MQVIRIDQLSVYTALLIELWLLNYPVFRTIFPNVTEHTYAHLNKINFNLNKRSSIEVTLRNNSYEYYTSLTTIQR